MQTGKVKISASAPSLFILQLSHGHAQQLRLSQTRLSAPISASDSLHLIEELFHFLYWLCRSYSPNSKVLGKIDFNPQLIQQPQAQGKTELTLLQLQTLETQLGSLVLEVIS